MNPEAQQGVHKIIFAGNRIEMPKNPIHLLPLRNLFKSEVDRLFPFYSFLGLVWISPILPYVFFNQHVLKAPYIVRGVSFLRFDLWDTDLHRCTQIRPIERIYQAGQGKTLKNTFEGMFFGMGLMVCFGIGTVPALFLVAKLADLGWLKSRELIYKISAVLMIIVGVYFVIKGIRY